MRIICFFDLPTLTSDERRAYRNFRKTLLKNGFFMMQESVYCKMVLNQTAQHLAIDAIKRGRPDKGLVQVLSVTEKQFSTMEFITGSFSSDVIDSDERLIIL